MKHTIATIKDIALSILLVSFSIIASYLTSLITTKSLCFKTVTEDISCLNKFDLCLFMAILSVIYYFTTHWLCKWNKKDLPSFCIHCTCVIFISYTITITMISFAYGLVYPEASNLLFQGWWIHTIQEQTYPILLGIIIHFLVLVFPVHYILKMAPKSILDITKLVFATVVSFLSSAFIFSALFMPSRFGVKINSIASIVNSFREYSAIIIILSTMIAFAVFLFEVTHFGGKQPTALDQKKERQEEG